MAFAAASAVGKPPPEQSREVAGGTGTTINLTPRIVVRPPSVTVTGGGPTTAQQVTPIIRDVVASTIAELSKGLANSLGVAIGNFIGERFKKGFTFSPTLYMSDRDDGSSGTGFTLHELITALERAHMNLTIGGQHPAPADCVHYYLELDELADDEPNIAREPLALADDQQARACRINTPAAMSTLLAAFAKR
jgi:hypothetical protein